jgi:hypothetical protein
MKSNGRFFAAIVVGLLVLLICGFIGWRVSHRSFTDGEAADPGTTAAMSNSVGEVAGSTNATRGAGRASAERDPYKPIPVAPWLAKLDSIVTSDNPSDENKVEQMAALMPGLPMDAQLEYARQMSIMLDDTNYTPVAKILLSPTTSSNVFNVLFTEFVSRGNALKLPMYLEMMKIPNHVYNQQAHEVLKTYLRQDFGDNWDQWDQGIKGYLKMTGAIE